LKNDSRLLVKNCHGLGVEVIRSTIVLGFATLIPLGLEFIEFCLVGFGRLLCLQCRFEFFLHIFAWNCSRICGN